MSLFKTSIPIMFALFLFGCSSNSSLEKKVIQEDSIPLSYINIKKGIFCDTFRVSCLIKQELNLIEFQYNDDEFKNLGFSKLKLNSNGKRKIQMLNKHDVMIDLPIIDSGFINIKRASYPFYIGLNNSETIDGEIYYIISSNFGLISTGSITWNNHLLITYFDDSKFYPLLMGIQSQALYKLYTYFERKNHESNITVHEFKPPTKIN